MQRARAVAHISLWLFVLAAFFYVGAPKVLRRAPRGSIAPVGDTSFHSSDTLLRFATGASNASQHLIAFFELAPPGKRIVIIDHEDDPASSLIAMLTAYLAWPHPVELAELVRTRASRAEKIKLDRSPPAAIVFCRLGRPADLAEGKHFGRGLEIVPIAMDKP